MENLSDQSRIFFEDLLRYSWRVHNGYYIVQPRTLRFGNTKYKIHRIIYQLHYNVLLSQHEIIHHKDGNKLNNNIENLELITKEKHISHHHAGSIKIGKFKPSNKLSENKIKEILRLSKLFLKKNGKPNYSAIGRRLKISGLTVANYLKKKEGCDGL